MPTKPTSLSNARAFWITGQCQGELRSETLQTYQSEQDALVQTLFSGISLGTERLVYQGLIPTSEYQRMRAPNQQGAFPWPVKYGYCNVGRVVDGPKELVGKIVFSLFPHQDRFVASLNQLTVVPEGVPPKRAILAANMETAINGIWDSGLQIGDRVAVIGAGVVGCLVAYLASRVNGCEVELCDIDPNKKAIAQQLGLKFSLPQHLTKDIDRIFHASGNGNGLTTALDIAGQGATIVELSWYGDRRVELALGHAFHAKRLRICSSQVGHLPAHQTPRWTHARRLAFALSQLEQPIFDALISGESPFEELPQVMAELASRSRQALCHAIRYGAC